MTQEQAEVYLASCSVNDDKSPKCDTGFAFGTSTIKQRSE